MKYLNLFEEFTDNERNYLVNNNLTYIRKNKIEKINQTNDILNKISNYDITSFVVEYKPYGIFIYPDNNFKELLKQLNIEPNIVFELSVDESRLNIIDLYFDLNVLKLNGLNIGYKIYKMMINKFDYITSDYGIKPGAKNIWFKLMVDDNFYFITSNICSCVINKNISNERLIKIIEKLKNECYNYYRINYDELILDNKLKEKLIQLQWK